MLEVEIENYFNWTVALLGGDAMKFESPGQRGRSDRIAALPNGTTWFVELKRPVGGRMSAHQHRFAHRMAELRQRYALLHTKELIDEWGKARKAEMANAEAA